MRDSGPDSTDDPSYVTTWKEHTTGFDRVRSVASTLEEPKTASWIAEEAHVSEPTTRDHLSRLVDLGVLTTEDTSKGRTYYPDPIYTRLTALQELVSNNTETELTEQAASIQEDIAAWKDRYDVESPRELRRSVTGDIAAEDARERLRIASDWDSAQYHLSLLQDALDHYDTYTARPSASA